MASVHQRQDSFSVRWREGGKHRSRTFTANAQGSVPKARRAAEQFAVEVEKRKESGDLGYYRGMNSALHEVVANEWWPRYAEVELEIKTRELYSWLWNKHILPHLGDYRMREIRAGTIRDWRIELQREGLGEPTIRKAMSLLQGIFRWAAEDELIPPINPVQVVKKPSAPRQTEICPLTPDETEALRAELDPGSAALVSVLAYAGLRPEEALALTWADIRENTILVERRVVKGEIMPMTKTGVSRTVDLLPQLAEDLAEWRRQMDNPPDDALVFPYKDDPHKPWNRNGYENWRRRVFRKGMEAAGLRGRIYDLRHSFSMLLIQGGHRPTYVAHQLGHSVATSSRTYQHAFEEAGNPESWKDPSERIAEARTRRKQ